MKKLLLSFLFFSTYQYIQSSEIEKIKSNILFCRQQMLKENPEYINELEKDCAQNLYHIFRVTLNYHNKKMWPSNEYLQSISKYAQEAELNCPFIFDFNAYINDKGFEDDFNKFKDNYSHSKRPGFVKGPVIDRVKEKYPPKQEEYQFIETLD